MLNPKMITIRMNGMTGPLIPLMTTLVLLVLLQAALALSDFQWPVSLQIPTPSEFNWPLLDAVAGAVLPVMNASSFA